MVTVYYCLLEIEIDKLVHMCKAQGEGMSPCQCPSDTNEPAFFTKYTTMWSVVHISSTEACRDSSIPNYIGWMFLSESCTNSASWCSTACTVERLSTSWNCANQSQVSHHGNQSQVSHHGNIFDPPPKSSWSYRITSSAPMADGLSVWLVRWSGILCRTACGIRLLVGTVSDNL